MNDAPDALRSAQSSLPFLTADLAPVKGHIKRAPEDFVVEEVPAYLPTGSGEHLYLWIEKRGRNTPDAVRALCERLGVSVDDAGWAGLKDRNAVTRQWISLKCPSTPDAQSLEFEGLRVLEVARHGNKLRTGHLRGNRFALRLTEVAPEDDARVAAVLDVLRDKGLPHYFGSQRFGRDGNNIPAAHAWLVEGRRAPDKPFLRKLFASSLQSALFNVVLGERIAQGHYERALDGDVMRKEESGGMFVSTDPAVDGPRMASWELSPTGPMFGPSMRAAEREALAVEQAVLARFQLDPVCFERARKVAEGTRRPFRVRPEGVEVRREGDDLCLTFELPKGAYATSLVAEITKSRSTDLPDEA